MTSLRVRIGEADRPQPQLLWDSVWDSQTGCADWAMAGDDEPLNRGGLRAKAALHTAIIVALFTDKRCPDQHPHRKFIGDDDPRGWWGDDIDVRADLGEDELGSLLWIYERAPLNEEVRRFVEVAAHEALAPLIRQGVAARIDVEATMQAAVNRIDLSVQVYGRDNQIIHREQFSDIWKQASAT